MGCAPSKQNAELDTDLEKRPLPAKEKKSPKGRKSPKKDKGNKLNKDGKEQLSNNNAKDGPIVEERIVATESAPESAAPPSEQNGSAPVDADVHKNSDNLVDTRSAPGSPLQDIPAKYGDIWDMTKGMPPPTSPYDDDGSPPPKPDRSYEHEDGESQGRSFHTFPRSRQKQRPQSARDRYLEESDKDTTLERKQSLRERTPQRRKDLDLSGNIYMGKTIDPPGRGRKIDLDDLDFHHAETPETSPEIGSPKANVRLLAEAYLEQVKKKDELSEPKSPIRRPVRKIVEDDSDDDNKDISELDGNTSIIEVVNKEILEDYHEVPKKTFEEIEQERLQREAEEAEQERIRLEEEAERERIRLEEEAERERIRLEEEAEQERIRLEEEAERERIRLEEERERLEEEARVQAEEERLILERKQEEEAQRLLEEENQPLIEMSEQPVEQESAFQQQSEAIVEELEEHTHEDGGEADPAETGAQLEDRFYNNKAFEKPDIDSSNPEQQDAALRIQTKYRQHHAKQVVVEKRKEKAVVKIQAGYRGWHDRKRVDEIRSDVDAKSQKEAEEAQEDDAREDNINYDDPEVTAAATKIQAGFKGYKARKEVNDMKEKKAQTEQEPVSETAEPEVEKPAESKDDGTAQAAGEQTTETSVEQTNEESVEQTNEASVEQTNEKAAEQTEDKIIDETEEAEQTEDKPENTADQVKEGDVSADKETKPEEEYSVEQREAAAKIQAGVRGYLARKEVKVIKDGQATSLPEPGQEKTDESTELKDESTAEKTDPEADKQKSEEEVPKDEINYDDPEVQMAATKIQAGFKGMHARKQVQEMKDAQQTEGSEGQEVKTDDNQGQDEAATEEQKDSQETKEESAEVKGDEVKEIEAPPVNEDAPKEEIDIDLNDPDVNKAATKIQAGFKGYKTRKELAANKGGEAEDGAPPGEDEGQKDASPEEGATEEQKGDEQTTE